MHLDKDLRHRLLLKHYRSLPIQIKDLPVKEVKASHDVLGIDLYFRFDEVFFFLLLWELLIAHFEQVSKAFRVFKSTQKRFSFGCKLLLRLQLCFISHINLFQSPVSIYHYRGFHSL